MCISLSIATKKLQRCSQCPQWHCHGLREGRTLSRCLWNWTPWCAIIFGLHVHSRLGGTVFPTLFEKCCLKSLKVSDFKLLPTNWLAEVVLLWSCLKRPLLPPTSRGERVPKMLGPLSSGTHSALVSLVFAMSHSSAVTLRASKPATAGRPPIRAHLGLALIFGEGNSLGKQPTLL